VVTERAESPRDIVLGDTFDSVAALYDRARPSYPDELVDDLVAEVPGPRVLEIGCGTGKLTRALVDRGLDVACVEPGANLAAVARRIAPVTVARFEAWEPDGTYDAVCCATAWHWLDPEIAPRKAHDLLRPGGVLAIINAIHVFPPDADPFFRDIQVVYDSFGERAVDFPSPEEIRHDYLRPVEACGLFDIDTRGYLRVIEYTADAYIDVLRTYSGHIAMPDEHQQTLYDGVRRLAGDRLIRKHYLFSCHVARRIG
jgi:SAM-dependent methyltransferase